MLEEEEEEAKKEEEENPEREFFPTLILPSFPFCWAHIFFDLAQIFSL